MIRDDEPKIIKSDRFTARAAEAIAAQDQNKASRGFVVRMHEARNIRNIAAKVTAKEDDTVFYDPKLGGRKRYPGYGSK